MKTLKNIFYGICILFIVWIAFSWVDIVSDNTRPNPQHSDLNFFVVAFQSGYEKAHVYEINGDEIVCETSNGNLWACYVDDPESFVVGMRVRLVFDGDELVDLVY